MRCPPADRARPPATLSVVFTLILTVLTVLGSFAVCAWLVWIIARGSGEPDRRAEEAARDYYDVHGRWPDESSDT